MARPEHFRPPEDHSLTPWERGGFAAARGVPIEECPYDDRDEILGWQNGWRARIARLRMARLQADREA